MKKILSLLLLISICITMTSCHLIFESDLAPDFGDFGGLTCQHSWNEGEITTEPTADMDGVMTFTCTLCGATRTEKVQYSGFLTKELFIEIMQKANFTATIESELTPGRETVYAIGDEAMYVCYYGNNAVASEAFIVLKDGKWYTVQNYGKGFVGTETEKPAMTIGYVCGVSSDSLSTVYDSLVFDKEKDAYYCSRISTDTVKFYLYFDMGTIIKLERIDTSTENPYTQTTTFTAVGTTVVTKIPTWTIGE